MAHGEGYVYETCRQGRIGRRSQIFLMVNNEKTLETNATLSRSICPRCLRSLVRRLMNAAAESSRSETLERESRTDWIRKCNEKSHILTTIKNGWYFSSTRFSWSLTDN
ncbi:hypothetical protein OS493_017912 [Desmophyllum pertusum]|uniref:Uncharacterized protein n=1 Tax=Desmophyllum pertusum TaxID=174260 RepID=A0A9X0CRD0_9CNID|nr:hypothetical protein OS493_017912 [Desmophyllum pertusum]